MLPTDIAHLTTLGLPALTPDGRTAVVTASRPDLDADRYDTALWSVDLDGSAPPRRLTQGPGDSAPQFSPDGRWLAFLRAPQDQRPQLHLLPTAGGDAFAVTGTDDLPGGAGAPIWAPDSRSIAFVARVPDEGRYGRTPGRPPEKEAPRRITGLQYRLDGVGFVLDRRQHVFVLDVDDDGAAAGLRQLTDGDHEDADVTWSPDGDRLAFASARHERREHDLVRDVFVIGRDGSGLRRVSDESLALSRPVFSTDGGTILAVGAHHGPARSQWVAANVGLWSLPADGDGARPHRLTDEEGVHLSTERLVVDGDRVLVGMENRGAVELVAVPVGGGGHEVLSAGHRQITGVAAAKGTVAVAFSDPTSNGELGVLRDGALTTLTDFGAPAQDRRRPMTELTAAAPDGYPVHGWLVAPEGDGPHPVLLMIHGGPFAQYGWTLFDEAQVYAGAGYAVVYGNPRGSSGYGQSAGRYILGDVGARQTPDLLALLDAALERPELDESRVGVLGGSHGGFMTTWLMGTTDRFAAAVSERAVNAIDSFTGAGDIGWGFADALYGADPDQQRRQSPLTHADGISAPLLIIHSEQDWRCPLEQAQRLYVSLRRRGAPVEMLLFPGEGHEMSRSGLPSHRVARFAAIVEWFDRHLR